MASFDGLRLGQILESYRAAVPARPYNVSVVMAGRRITIVSDDLPFFADLFVAFGGDPPVPGEYAGESDIHVDLRTNVGNDFGYFKITGRDGLAVDGKEFSFAVEAQGGLFKPMACDVPGWTWVAYRDNDQLGFAFFEHGRECLFALDHKWRISVMWFLFWRLLRMRSDVIFFHASAIGIGGQGTIFVGQAGGGKSTTSLTLASRGHNFLSDEIAAYQPSTGLLLPFRRPVGIKPGPRSTAVQNGIGPNLAAQIETLGFVRVDINRLFPVAEARAEPLRRVVFLRGFADAPSLERITPGRPEVAELQPLMSSFLNESHSKRVFELVRLLNAAKSYKLVVGPPDETGVYLEGAFASE